MKVKEAELTFSLVEGEEETKFLEKAVADMKHRRSNMKGGRGGRFNNKRKNDGGGNKHYGKRNRGGD